MSDLARLKGLFFSYFAWVGLVSPFLGLYLAEREFSIAQIGVLLSVPQWMRIVSPPFWGWLADSVARPVALLWISTALSLMVVILLPLMVDVGFWAVFALLALLFFVSGAQMPIGEARTLVATRGDSGAYGRIRLWGSIGFIVAVSLGGLALDAFGTRSLPAWMALTLVCLLAVVWPMRQDAAVAIAQAGAHSVSVLRRLRSAYIAYFVLGNALMIFAHAAYYVLFSLFLAHHGYSKTAIGLLWTLGVLVEVALFRWQHLIFARFSVLALLAFSVAVAAVRFAMIGASGGALPVILAAQLLHAITFGLHHSAVMLLLHRWFDAAQQARAQALYMTTAYGVGGAAGGLAMSMLWARVSPSAAFFGAALAAALGALAIIASAYEVRRAGAA